jgi:pimeloyl-ACP methyl ester carboxylesterase
MTVLAFCLVPPAPAGVPEPVRPQKSAAEPQNTSESVPDNPNLPAKCRKDDIRTIQLPVHPGQRGSKSFTYRYHLREAEDPAAPLVIFIPGGPGQSSIGATTSIPSGLGLARTDPRGAGCNANAVFSADSLSSEAIAADILALIRDVKPKRYFLYGSSYGTVVATIVAARAGEEGVPRPAGVVLEGTIGRSFQPKESLEGFVEGWEELKTKLPPAVVRQLSSSPLPLGFSAEAWGGWIQSLLLYGDSPGGGSFAVDQLSALDPSEPENRREVLAKLMNNFLAPAPKEHTRLYREITCREIDDGVRGQKTDMELRGGKLVRIENGFCSGIPLSSPFDSAAYQTSAPVFYFSGGQNSATPEFQTEYHFSSQGHGRKVWVNVPTGGHLALTMNLGDCYGKLWMDIAEHGGDDLEALLPGCMIKPSPVVKRKP